MTAASAAMPTSGCGAAAIGAPLAGARDVEPVAVDNGPGGADRRDELLAADRAAGRVGGKARDEPDARALAPGLPGRGGHERRVSRGVTLQALRLNVEHVGVRREARGQA